MVVPNTATTMVMVSLFQDSVGHIARAITVVHGTLILNTTAT
jgi:hypothetical protein